MSVIQLARGELELVVDAARGGSIMAFRDQGFDLMRPWDGRTEDPRFFASFPLVPYSGRIDHARFDFDGRPYALAPNFPPEPNAIHGDGWTSPWQVIERDASTALIELVHGGDVPLRYRALQRFTLRADALTVIMSVTNQGPRPMPFGLGHHPYFDKRPGTLLSAEVTGVWLPDAGNVPQTLAPVPIEWGFRLRRSVEELTMDANFQGWSGLARIDWPNEGHALEITADPLYRHLVVYVPEGQTYFCVEPVSMVGNGFNHLARGRTDTGVRVLKPGETLEGTMRFAPRRT